MNKKLIVLSGKKRVGKDTVANNGLSETAPWEAHIAKDIANLLQCEGIYMLQGWEESQGARIEHAMAKDAKLIVFYE